ncbi:MAG TPA: hypothetical protein VMR81_08360 [Patescibacteria group bacterium]|nr:hypothetical protein [Patescibacteria group bacterium]
MLTKTDLQAIDNLVTKRVNEAIDTRVGDIVTKRIREELKPMKEDIVKIRKDINVIVSFFDREYTNLRTRVERIEEHLQLPAISS